MAGAPPKAPRRRDPEWRYWDSTVFLAWLLKEPDRLGDCRAILQAAARGDVRIATSTITLTEVIHLKNKPTLTRERDRAIREFFQHTYISLRQVDRFIAEDARELIWQQGLKPKDSIHVATALRWHMRVLETHDTELIALDGKLGKPKLTIRLPQTSETFPLPLATKKAAKGS